MVFKFAFVRFSVIDKTIKMVLFDFKRLQSFKYRFDDPGELFLVNGLLQDTIYSMEQITLW